MRVTNRFAKGSGVYVCRCCGRKTRSTGRGDNEFLTLCAECYDLGGIENAILDGEDIAVHRAEARRLYAIIKNAGGEPSFDYCAECGIDY